MKMTYKIFAKNNSGAGDSSGYDYTSINAAIKDSRSFYGKGWKISITDRTGCIVREFKTRK